MLENYQRLENGLIKQLVISKKFEYNTEYITKNYNTYGIKRYQMAGLRLGYLISSIGKLPNSILDVGYGNGDFLELCKNSINYCHGNDVSGYPIPEGVTYISDITRDYYDVICFFDVLEHFEDISIVKNLKCEYLYISVPWCHYTSDEWFKNWKHRRPNEHLWHFNENSIKLFFEENGYELIKQSNVEDIIRKSNQIEPNILTCIFKKTQ
jgi:hypothetical protein